MKNTLKWNPWHLHCQLLARTSKSANNQHLVIFILLLFISLSKSGKFFMRYAIIHHLFFVSFQNKFHRREPHTVWVSEWLCMCVYENVESANTNFKSLTMALDEWMLYENQFKVFSFHGLHSTHTHKYIAIFEWSPITNTPKWQTYQFMSNCICLNSAKYRSSPMQTK